jgi:hypothetical protein
MTKIAVSRYVITKKIPPMDPFWPQFNASFENMDLNTVEITDVIGEGRAITTWHKNHWRSSENYLLGQFLGLDFDAGDETSYLPLLMQDKFSRKYAAFGYSTISHTSDFPRSRLIFLLDQPIMQAKNYALAATALLWVYGTADRQCKDAVRFFYGSKGCDFEYQDNVLPLAVVKGLIADYQAAGRVEKHNVTRSDYHAPTAQCDVSGALDLIPPWGIAYDEWVEILMAIHAAFGEDGYSLAASWADGKPGEVEQKWRSFHQVGNTAGAVTIATVFGIAKRFGWSRSN